jgi:ectoine hydroxylase-related dioxygenase (phytanoyl-CoA dioxygenase family)
MGSTFFSSRYISEYRDQGFAIVKNVFELSEIQQLSQAFNELQRYASSLSGSFRHKNQLYVFQDGHTTAKLLRFVRWPSYTFPVFEKYRTDSRVLNILTPLIGNDLKQITNQAVWKTPGDSRTSYSYHQDAYWRQPATAYRDLPNSFVQVAIAIDPHGSFNGGLKMVAGSHKIGYRYQHAGSVMTNIFSTDLLEEYGLNKSDIVTLEMSPGDIAIWHPYLFHGSAPNDSLIDRRLYINGYVNASNCDRGEYAFKKGVPVTLGEPCLVDYDALYTRSEPHYI